MTGESDPVKKDILSHCIEKRNQLVSEGARVINYEVYKIQNTAGRHDVSSPVLMSGTRVFYFNFISFRFYQEWEKWLFLLSEMLHVLEKSLLC